MNERQKRRMNEIEKEKTEKLTLMKKEVFEKKRKQRIFARE